MNPDKIIDMITKKNNPNYKHVIFKSNNELVLSNSIIEKYKIIIGNEYDQKTIDNLKNIISIDNTRKAAMKIISTKDYSHEQLRSKLSLRGLQFTKEVCDELKENGWISDIRVAESIALKGIDKCHSNSMILNIIFKAGIHENDAIKSTEIIFKSNPEKNRLEKFCSKEMKKMSRFSNTIIAKRLFGKLSRRGWEKESIISTLRKLEIYEEDT